MHGTSASAYEPARPRGIADGTSGGGITSDTIAGLPEGRTVISSDARSDGMGAGAAMCTLGLQHVPG